jgi:hypothetical protein
LRGIILLRDGHGAVFPPEAAFESVHVYVYVYVYVYVCVSVSVCVCRRMCTCKTRSML